MSATNAENYTECILSDLRDSIARIDESIVQLLVDRVKIGQQIAMVKCSADIPIHDAEQESRVIQRSVKRAHDLALPDDDVRKLFCRIIGMTRRAEYGVS
ncbi:MAG: chorismate mutase [Gemmatimonadaceae bacterium]